MFSEDLKDEINLKYNLIYLMNCPFYEKKSDLTSGLLQRVTPGGQG